MIVTYRDQGVYHPGLSDEELGIYLCKFNTYMNKKIRFYRNERTQIDISVTEEELLIGNMRNDNKIKYMKRYIEQLECRLKPKHQYIKGTKVLIVEHPHVWINKHWIGAHGIVEEPDYVVRKTPTGERREHLVKVFRDSGLSETSKLSIFEENLQILEDTGIRFWSSGKTIQEEWGLYKIPERSYDPPV